MREAVAIIEKEMVPKVPGLSVGVAVGGKTVWSHRCGYADWAAKTPVTAATRFRIASVSKPLTAAGLALLVERGQLDLDAPVQKYVPDFPDTGAVITTRLLAGHLSGIRHYRGTEAVSNQSFPDLRAGLSVFENDPLETPPGSKFNYSSYNWNVIGAVMEGAAKKDFPEYMEENVIKPLGMTNTVPDRDGVADPQRALFYETDRTGKFFLAPPVNNTYRLPSGGYLSTVEDLVRFGCAHLQPGFFKPETLRLLFTSQATANGTPTHYGVGWFTKRTLFFHGGDCLGGTAILLLRPGSATVVAMVSNGSQLLLRNAISRGKAPKEASRFLVHKEAIAEKIAKVFAPAST